ncbi:PREDICTED: KIF1-binding protein homolog [Dufourea novaeangliae]|uniref:KIF1-binding protein homolog n=1 Tax=Dufourea novaeangliae TaxID=178035 RepID=UPI0007671FA6|nr:PREDICTED: KIF1-binding protein homolog [Dufourea novaeangliae]KZC15140.1 KIF1-binding protein like protein [Dufourea novaeangliae]
MESNEVQDVLTNIRVKYKEVQKLLDDHKILSMENEPYKIKYQAIKDLQAMETDLTTVLKNTHDRENRLIIMFAVLHLNLGLLHADTEELKAGEERLIRCLNLLKDKELETEAVLIVLSALNQLGIIWSQWSQFTKAKAFLDRAEQIYNDYTGNDNREYRDPISMLQSFGIEEAEPNPKEVLEKIHTLTLYYLAQVYSSLEDHYKSAIYCHMTLRRQLGYYDFMKDLDYIDWALNAATLSQYFMENEGFTQARHHLAAASYVLQMFENTLKKKTEFEGETEAIAAEWENFKHRSADVARCWAKYGILLLSLSKQRLLQNSETEHENNPVSNNDTLKLQLMEDLKFHVLEERIEPIVNQISDKYLLDFTDARLVFLNAQKWLEQAKLYYTLEDHASDHILIVQDISKTYKYLSFFEEHEDRQARMHKRRIDILENIIKELNPQYYKSACRQIWIELGETYSDILETKIHHLRSTNERPTPQVLAKINHLANSSIKNFQMFLDSLETRTSDCGMEQFPEDLLQPALFSYFHLGKLHNKFISPDKTIQLENVQNSLNAYKFVVDYCGKYPKAAEVVKVELSLCKELVKLLPVEINRLRTGIIS